MTTKTCKMCEEEKPFSYFYKEALNKDGLQSSCKKCIAKKNRDLCRARKEATGRSMTDTMTEYHKERYKRQRDRYNERAVEWRKSHPERIFYNLARARARDQKLPFDLTHDDVVIPEVCPVLGIPLFFSGRLKPNTPSLDKFIPELGYVKGNVAVISLRANILKRDGTLDELQKLVTWMQAQPQSSRDPVGEECQTEPEAA